MGDRSRLLLRERRVEPGRMGPADVAVLAFRTVAVADAALERDPAVPESGGGIDATAA